MALRRSSTTRDVLGSLVGLGLPRHGGTALKTRSAGTRRVRVPMLLFSKAPLGPRGDLDSLFAVGGHGGAVLAF